MLHSKWVFIQQLLNYSFYKTIQDIESLDDNVQIRHAKKQQ